jgi:hypothetical protein
LLKISFETIGTLVALGGIHSFKNLFFNLHIKEVTMKTLNKTLLATAISGLALSSAVTVQAESFDSLYKDGSIDINFRYRVESNDVEGTAADTALANTLKSRATIKTGSVYGFSALVEGDNVFHVTDDFNSTENGNTDYDKVVDPETTQLNQAYLQYAIGGTTIKAGNQRILLDNQRHVGGVGFRQDEATFDSLSVKSKAGDATIFAAVANNRNTITNTNTEEDIVLVNAKYAVSKELATTAFYYGIDDTNGTAGLDFDTFGLRASGSAAGFGFEAEIATQNKTTAAGGDFDSTYLHLAGSKKFGGVKATIGYESFGSDGGAAAFATPLGTNHKFFGWSDVMLKGNQLSSGDAGLTDIYASAVTKVAGVKLVGQFHKFDSVEGSDDLGTEIGFLAAKKFGSYGASLKLAQYNAGDLGSDVTKVWLTGTAKF